MAYRRIVYDAHVFDIKPGDGEYAAAIYMGWQRGQEDHLVVRATVAEPRRTAREEIELLKVHDASGLYPAYLEIEEMPGLLSHAFEDPALQRQSPYFLPVLASGEYRFPLKMMEFERTLVVLAGYAVSGATEEEAAAKVVSPPSYLICGWPTAYGSNRVRNEAIMVIPNLMTQLFPTPP